MSELISNLNTIESCKLDIKSAIEAKGVDMTGVSFPGYATAIGSISGGTTGYTLKQCVEVNDYLSSEISDSTITYVAPYAFIGGFNYYSNGASYQYFFTNRIVSVTLQNCSCVYYGGFQLQDILTTVNIPNCTELYEFAFEKCSSLMNVSFPNCLRIEQSCFKDCTNLTTVTLPVCTVIKNYCFQGCTNLTTITLGASTVCTLESWRAFSMVTNLTSIYVPSSLVSDYQSARNWSSFSTKIVAIPE